MSEIRFDERVAIITGAGNGLGRSYAHYLSARGARILVNDLGGGTNGDGGSTRPADQVVEEIRAAGGEATANYDSVASAQGGEAIVETALGAGTDVGRARGDIARHCGGPIEALDGEHAGACPVNREPRD